MNQYLSLYQIFHVIFNSSQMGGKGKNKYKGKGSHSNKGHGGGHNHIPSEQQIQILTVQCLQIHELLTKNMKQLQNEKMCHLLSKKWLSEWKKYVGYEQISKGKMQEGKIPKGMGSRQPGSINQNMKKTVKDYYQIPKQMQQYQYLNIVLNDKLDKDEDYMPAGQNLWKALLQRYEVVQDIPRPIRKNKKSFYYDAELIQLDLIFVNHFAVQQFLQTKEKREFSKNDKNKFFDSKKMQFSTIWQFQDLEEFLIQYIKYAFQFVEQNQDTIEIWKVWNYIQFTQIQNNICEQIISKKYKIYANQLKAEDLQDLDTDQFLKSQYTLIIQFNGQKFKSAQIPQKIKGYCEQCIKVKDLIYRCQCGIVQYCSMQCLVDDRIFHSKYCRETFKSQDDQEYESKHIKHQQDFMSSGLQNLGNTCYMNSSFQYLMTVSDFRDFFSSNDYLKELKQDSIRDTTFLKKLSKFCKKLSEADKPLAPWSIKSQVNYNMNPFKGYKQHDANDFLTSFITLTNECLKQYKEEPFHPIIKQNFLGYFDSRIECPNCQYKVENVQMYTQLTLSIRNKVKKQLYSYAVIRKDQIVRGKAQVQATWQQILANLRVGNKAAAIYQGKQGDHLYCIDREQVPQKQIKGLKGKELIIFPELVINEGEQQFSFIQTSIKKISGVDAKSPVGYPFIIKIDSRINTIMEFWIQIVKDFVDKQVVDNLIRIQKQFKQWLIQKQSKLNKEDTQAQKQIKQTSQIKLENRQSQDKDNQIQQEKFKLQISDKFQAVISQAGISVYIEDTKRHKNICYFCKKKCRNCNLPVLVGVTVEQYLLQKMDDVRFQISFKNKITPKIETKNFASSDSSLQQCFELFKIPQQLDEQNAWWCQICQDMRLAIKTISIKTLPKYLIIQLSRFKADGDRKIKNNQPIQYSQIESFEGQQYRLLAVIIHQGSMEAGHYWAICLRGNRYYIYNDEKVTQTDKICNKGAYILLYKKI